MGAAEGSGDVDTIGGRDAYMTWPPPLMPQLVSIAGRNEEAVSEAATRNGFEGYVTDWSIWRTNADFSFSWRARSARDGKSKKARPWGPPVIARRCGGSVEGLRPVASAYAHDWRGEGCDGRAEGLARTRFNKAGRLHRRSLQHERRAVDAIEQVLGPG